MAEQKHPYADILSLPHHKAFNRPQMSMYDRAAQFSPFAALTGFEGVIAETGRLTEQKAELSENEKDYDRITVQETIKVLLKLGYDLKK